MKSRKLRSERGAAERFFRLLLRGAPQGLGVQICARAASGRTRAVSVVDDPLRACVLARELDAHGEDVYVTPALFSLRATGRTEADCRGLSALTLDLDIEGSPMSDGSTKARGAPNRPAAIAISRSIAVPTFVVSSGYGVHAWHLFRRPWLFESGEDLASAKRLFAAWQRAHRQQASWEIDSSTGGIPRLLRVPGTSNHKVPEAPRPVKLARLEGSMRHSVKDLTARVEAHIEYLADAQPSVALGDIELTVGRLADLRRGSAFDRVWTDEQRFESGSERDLVLAKEAIRLGATDEEAAGAIRLIREDAKGERIDYLERTVGRARQELAADPRLGPRRLGRRTARLEKYDLLAMAASEPPEIDYVIDRFAAPGEVTVLWGRPGEGKSMLMQALCNGVAQGQTVGGLGCRRGRALYIDCENGEREVHRRVHALGLDTSGAISIYNGLHGLRLMSDQEAIDAVIAREGPSLVVLDSLRKLTYGMVENESGPMGEALAVCQDLAKRHDTAVVVIHHARKSGDAFRGSSAIEAETSMSFKFAREEGDADRTRRYLDCEKCRIDREPDRRWLALLDDPDAGTITVEDADSPSALVSGPMRTTLAEQILDCLTRGPWTRPRLAKHLGRDPKDRTVRRAFKDLRAQGAIDRDDDTDLWHVVAGGTPVSGTHATGGNDGGAAVADATPGGTARDASHPPPATHHGAGDGR